jgi:hypothetical protein
MEMQWINLIILLQGTDRIISIQKLVENRDGVVFILIQQTLKPPLINGKMGNMRSPHEIVWC